MTGLRLDSAAVFRGPGVTSGNGFSNPNNPRTATEAAFGDGYTQTGTPSTANALTPDDPFGVAFWTGVIALGLLIALRHSLPA